MLDAHNRKEKDLLIRLKKRQARELQAVCGLPPPKQVLRTSKRFKNQERAASASQVLKEHADTPPRLKTASPVVVPITPARDDRDSNSTESERSVPVAKLADSAPSRDTTSSLDKELLVLCDETTGLRTLGTELVEEDDLSELSHEDQQDTTIMGRSSAGNNAGIKKKPPARSKAQDKKVKELKAQLDHQGKQLNAANKSYDELLQVNESLTKNNDTTTQFKKLTEQISVLKTNLETYENAREGYLKASKDKEDKIEKLETQVLKLQTQIESMKGQAPPTTANEDLKKLQLELNDTVQDCERFKAKNQEYFWQIGGYKNKIFTLEQKVSTLEEQIKSQPSVSTESHSEEAEEEIKALKLQISGLEDQILKLQRSSAAAVKDGSLAVELEQVKKQCATLVNTNKTLVAQYQEAMSVLKNTGKFVKGEVSKGVAEKIGNWITSVGYRQTKFCVGDKQVDDFCEEVYDAIKNDPALKFGDNTDPEHYKPFEEFKRVYSQTCQSKLNDRRQYTQTQCLKAVLGTFSVEFCR